MKKIPDGSVDLVLCDLPYGITDCKWDNVIPTDKLWAEYRRVLKANGAAALFGAQPFTTELINSNRRDFRYCWYWKKNNVTGFAYARYQPMRCIEDICVFYRKAPTYNPQGLKKLNKPRRRNGKLTTTVYNGETLSNETVQIYGNYPRHLLEFSNDAIDARKRLHPTQKPVALLEYLIRTYTDEGETVLDNCMGSGSTGVAAKRTGRNFIGIELSEQYFEIAKKRIEETP